MAIISNPGESRGENGVCLMRNMVCFYNQLLKPNYKGRFFLFYNLIVCQVPITIRCYLKNVL